MLYLIATILANAVLYIIFKCFPKYKIDALQAIVVNYFTCVVTGSLLAGTFPVSASSAHQPWFGWALLMGGIFISLFYLMSYCTRVDGITTTTIANKLSMVIPVVFSIFLYSETVGVLKIVGIALAFPAVYLTTRVKDDGQKAQNLWPPALLFIGSGLLDTLVKYVEDSHLKSTDVQVSYLIHLFLTAAVLGSVLVAVRAFSGKTRFQFKNVLAGILLGVPNYFSIYYLVRLLNSDFLQSSAAIPVNNIGIVLVSALAAMLFFKEKVSAMRIIGLVLSIVSILLIAFSDMKESL